MPENMDLYSDAAPGETPAQPSSPPEREATEEESEGSTGLLPKSFFAGSVRPGDEVTVKIVQVYDDEVEVTKTGGRGHGPMGPPPDTEMASMME